MGTVVVVGGSGRTGRLVADRVLARGDRLRVVSRHPHPRGEQGVETVRADLGALTDPGALLDGATGVVVSVEPPYDAAGAETVLHRGVARLADAAAAASVPVVLVSQIYVTRPEAYPAMAAVTEARARGEQALRGSGAPHAVVRPGWLHDGPAGGVRLEQGDTGDGPVSRAAVAQACVAALARLPAVSGLTFEIFDDAAGADPDWGTLIEGLAVPGRDSSV
jgi:uncharacterized protein YbjT (DUF2867 family)